MRNTVLGMLAGIFVGAFLFGQPIVNGQRSLDPLVVAPDHFKLEFENEYVRVIREHTDAHGKVPMHEHSLPGINVLLGDQNVRQTQVDGSVRDLHRKAGEVYWTAPSIHAGENMSDAPLEYIRIDIKNAVR